MPIVAHHMGQRGLVTVRASRPPRGRGPSRCEQTLVTATGLVWLAAIVWTYVDSRAQFESILDRRLMIWQLRCRS
jgi:hypothetical protein